MPYLAKSQSLKHVSKDLNLNQIPNIKKPTLTALPYAIWIALLITGGCQQNNPDSFTVAVEALPQPNQYQTHLKWNINDDDADGWMIQRKTDKDSLSTIVTTGKDAHEYIDSSVVAGTTYHYVLSASSSDASSSNRALDITVPRDLAITGVTVLPNVSGIGRLMIPKGSKIVTNGKDIDLAVDQIISDGGSIETFTEGQTAAANTPGRPGGQIKIHARTGNGSLTLVARGEVGGPSTVGGTQGATGFPGPRGNNAVCGFKDNDAVCGMSLSDFRDWQQKCKQGGIFGALYCQLLNRFSCKLQPGNGGQGGQGFTGGTGPVGVKGGDSGNILVEITDPTNIQINPISIAGAGGLGGPGGAGGYGGNSGPPGARDPLGICTGFGHWGLPGPQGPSGPQGASGIAGAKSIACIRLGPTATGDCSKF